MNIKQNVFYLGDSNKNPSTKEYIELFSVTGSHTGLHKTELFQCVVCWAQRTDDKENDEHFENTNFEVTPASSSLM